MVSYKNVPQIAAALSAPWSYYVNSSHPYQQPWFYLRGHSISQDLFGCCCTWDLGLLLGTVEFIHELQISNWYLNLCSNSHDESIVHQWVTFGIAVHQTLLHYSANIQSVTMTQKPSIVRKIQMLAITIVILCFVQVSSFAFNPLKCISIKSQHNNLIGVRFFNTNHVKPTMIKLSPLKLSQSTDEQVKSSKAVPFLNIANILTISRVLAIPFFMLSFVMRKVPSFVTPTMQ